MVVSENGGSPMGFNTKIIQNGILDDLGVQYHHFRNHPFGGKLAFRICSSCLVILVLPGHCHVCHGQTSRRVGNGPSKNSIFM